MQWGSLSCSRALSWCRPRHLLPLLRSWRASPWQTRQRDKSALLICVCHLPQLMMGVLCRWLGLHACCRAAWWVVCRDSPGACCGGAPQNVSERASGAIFDSALLALLLVTDRFC